MRNYINLNFLNSLDSFTYTYVIGRFFICFLKSIDLLSSIPILRAYVTFQIIRFPLFMTSIDVQKYPSYTAATLLIRIKDKIFLLIALFMWFKVHEIMYFLIKLIYNRFLKCGSKVHFFICGCVYIKFLRQPTL